VKRNLERDLATLHISVGAANLSEAKDREADVKDDSQAVLAIDIISVS
jgi:hypothetical protein